MSFLFTLIYFGISILVGVVFEAIETLEKCGVCQWCTYLGLFVYTDCIAPGEISFPNLSLVISHVSVHFVTPRNQSSEMWELGTE